MKFPLFGGQSNGVNVVDFDQNRHKNIYVSLNARIKLITFEIFVANKCDLCLPYAESQIVSLASKKLMIHAVCPAACYCTSILSSQLVTASFSSAAIAEKTTSFT